MTLSKYHQKYVDQSNEEIKRKAEAKEEELVTIFQSISLNTNSNFVKIAVLGCGDKRFVAEHKNIFEKVLKKNVEIITFDIVIDHLEGEASVFKYDCTLPLPNVPYDINYGHVLLKFIKKEKQFNLLKNSYDALKTGGVAIHILDYEEVKAKEEKLSNDLWSVNLVKLEEQLTKENIGYKEIPLKYGPALVLLKR